MQAWTLTPEDAEYPQGLLDLASPPLLRVRGALPKQEGVTIVGTRASTEQGDRFAFELGADLARAGLAVWSGGALGIDGSAHRGALAGGGPTVVVIGGGIEKPTPTEHLDLFVEVVERGGAIVSRQEDDHPAATRYYHARNAVLAAATRLTVVVECPLRSGAMSTVQHARLLSRAVAFVPHAPWMPRGSGCVAEIQNGAQLVTSSKDVLTLLGREPATEVPTQFNAAAAPGSLRSPKRAQKQPSAKPSGRRKQAELFDHAPSMPVSLEGLSPLEMRIVEALDHAVHIDQLCDRLSEPVTVLVPALFSLVIANVVIEDAPSVFRRAR